jgi:hypothetical protein
MVSMAGPDEPEKAENENDEAYQVGLSEEMSFSLRVGGSYLVKEKKAETAERILIRLIKMGMRGMIISGTIPKKIRNRYELNENELQMIWLSTTEGDVDAYNPSKLDYDIMDGINDFIKNGGKAILLESLDIIELANGFDKAVEFVKTLSDIAAVHDSIFLLTINPTAFQREKLATLEWQLESIRIPGFEPDEQPQVKGETSKADAYAAQIDELQNRMSVQQMQRESIETDNRKLADSIISVSRELENMHKILNLKEEEIINLQKENVEMHSELREVRLASIGNSGMEDDVLEHVKDLNERIDKLEGDCLALADEIEKRDNEIKQLNNIIREKDEQLKKKQDMLKGLLAKVTDVEVRINTKQKYPPKEVSVERHVIPPKVETRETIDVCPNCGSHPTRIYGADGTPRIYCEQCKKWLRV